MDGTRTEMNPSETLEARADATPRPATLGAARRRPIGAILLDSGLIAQDGIERTLKHGRDAGLRFGDAAIALGLIDRDALAEVLAFQFDHAHVQDGASGISPEVVTAFASRHPALDEFRALRNQVHQRWLAPQAGGHRSLAVTSVDRGEGRSFVAANLAVSFSQMARRTLLIDADLRRPSQHRLFGLRNELGLAALLADRADPAPQRIAALPNLSVLTSGGLPPNPDDLLTRPRLREWLRELEPQYDVVILDTPAAAGASEAPAVAAAARGCVLVARHDRSRFGAVRDLAAELGAAGAVVVGSILLDA